MGSVSIVRAFIGSVNSKKWQVDRTAINKSFFFREMLRLQSVKVVFSSIYIAISFVNNHCFGATQMKHRSLQFQLQTDIISKHLLIFIGDSFVKKSGSSIPGALK